MPRWRRDARYPDNRLSPIFVNVAADLAERRLEARHRYKVRRSVALRDRPLAAVSAEDVVRLAAAGPARRGEGAEQPQRRPARALRSCCAAALVPPLRPACRSRAVAVRFPGAASPRRLGLLPEAPLVSTESPDVARNGMGGPFRAVELLARRLAPDPSRSASVPSLRLGASFGAMTVASMSDGATLVLVAVATATGNLAIAAAAQVRTGPSTGPSSPSPPDVPGRHVLLVVSIFVLDVVRAVEVHASDAPLEPAGSTAALRFDSLVHVEATSRPLHGGAASTLRGSRALRVHLPLPVPAAPLKAAGTVGDSVGVRSAEQPVGRPVRLCLSVWARTGRTGRSSAAPWGSQRGRRPSHARRPAGWPRAATGSPVARRCLAGTVGKALSEPVAAGRGCGQQRRHRGEALHASRRGPRTYLPGIRRDVPLKSLEMSIENAPPETLWRVRRRRGAIFSTWPRTASPALAGRRQGRCRCSDPSRVRRELSALFRPLAFVLSPSSSSLLFLFLLPAKFPCFGHRTRAATYIDWLVIERK